MFLLIPAILIFLCGSYLYLAENISIFTQSFIYSLIFAIIFVSFKIYSSIRKDMKKQEGNKIILQIQDLEKQLKKTDQESHKQGIEKKIKSLQKELESLLH